MAVDIGAGSGRIFTGAYDGKRLTIAEECRFFHKSITVRGESYLNFLGIWDAVKDGMMSCLAKKQVPSSIGFDSFAPDFYLRGNLSESLCLGAFWVCWCTGQ